MRPSLMQSVGHLSRLDQLRCWRTRCGLALSEAHILLLGSSVAAGMLRGLCSSPHGSWSQLLSERVRAHGLRMANFAVMSAGTSECLIDLHSATARCSPAVVIISLSLKNEGLVEAANDSAAWLVANRFLDGMRLLVSAVEAIGARPFLCGVYPNNKYERHHVRQLRRVNKEMAEWGYPYMCGAACLLS
ncbi:MAG: hypothetical protein SGPRY_012637 [Prymnesium sp.]